MKRLLAIIVASALLSGCAGKGAPGPSPTEGNDTPALLPPLDSFGWTARDCAELALFFQVPAANLRPHVHADFALVEAQGQATLGIGFARCANAEGLDNTTNNIVMSDVGAFIEDPDGGAAPALYQFWHASSRHLSYENMSRVGLPTQFAPHSHLLTFGLVQATLIETRIASEDGPYHAQGTSPSLPAPPQSPPPQNFRWWHASDNGTMYTDFLLDINTATAATGNVTATAGSLLETLLGATEASGEGIYQTFDMSVEARRV